MKITINQNPHIGTIASEQVAAAERAVILSLDARGRSIHLIGHPAPGSNSVASAFQSLSLETGSENASETFSVLDRYIDEIHMENLRERLRPLNYLPDVLGDLR